MTRVGPAGWAYKDWYGVVYPQKAPRGFQPASFLSRYFDTIELNVSFYRPATSKDAASWLKQTEHNPNFRFTAKLWRGFTHERTATAVETQQVLDGMAPLQQAGRLGALLLQFPWSFRRTPENASYLAKLRDQFAEFPLVVEVRHASWSEPGVLEFLDDLRLGLCNIDQPLFKRSIAPAAVATSPVGYIRLHGRNYKSWFSENRYYGERYDYLYSAEELDPWVDRIKAVERSTQDTYVITNNHYLGKAVVNATEIASILKGHPVPAPSSLIEHYPELQEYAAAEDDDDQLRL